MLGACHEVCNGSDIIDVWMMNVTNKTDSYNTMLGSHRHGRGL